MNTTSATDRARTPSLPLQPEALRRLRADPRFEELSRGASVAFTFATPSAGTVIGVHEGRLQFEGEPAFSITANREIWERLLAPVPNAGDQNIHALIRSGDAVFEGDALTFAQNLHLVHRVIDVAREANGNEDSQPQGHRPLILRGQYVRVDIPDHGQCDIYVERAGTGTPILCLPTAGSDTKQYHGLITETDLTDRYEIIAFDLPWHGKSNPAWGRRSTSYRLDSASYVGAIAAVTRALELSQPPALLGVSMAGAAVVEAIATLPKMFAGAVACQVGPRLAGRRTGWLRSALVNESLHVPEWTRVLMSPRSPAEMRDRVWWGYSQGGFGTYDADIAYYSESWDIDNVSPSLDLASPTIVVLSGAYDTSVPTSASQELAGAIPNSVFRVMPELGHFPHAENPRVFSEYLEWALQQFLDS
ncbi:MAG TPA: alpha/beta hydrolase [Candidatus Agrococcus pullicola]|uniref:Alpha/beta hydrolase n=1 Tax=Candidatus Agrococcus pullicola TaxID=2838429 RepID=A0A9D2C7C0_9MICO|nr:alpha/beta hydrolase [Candidatus Agrococcus pullicola]